MLLNMIDPEYEKGDKFKDNKGRMFEVVKEIPAYDTGDYLVERVDGRSETQIKWEFELTENLEQVTA